MMRTALTQALAQCSAILETLATLPAPLANSVYVDASIGRHLRHVLDHTLALKEGLTSELVDYDLRHRGSEIENDRLVATAQFSVINLWVQTEDFANRPVSVASEIDCNVSHRMQFESNLHREILYVINHTIHHAAHIKLALSHFGVSLPENIGIAPGTDSFNRTNQEIKPTRCAH